MEYVEFSYKYIDGDYFKSDCSVILTNVMGIPIEDIESALARAIDFEEFVPKLIKLPSVSVAVPINGSVPGMLTEAPGSGD